MCTHVRQKYSLPVPAGFYALRVKRGPCHLCLQLLQDVHYDRIQLLFLLTICVFECKVKQSCQTDTTLTLSQSTQPNLADTVFSKPPLPTSAICTSNFGEARILYGIPHIVYNIPNDTLRRHCYLHM